MTSHLFVILLMVSCGGSTSNGHSEMWMETQDYCEGDSCPDLKNRKSENGNTDDFDIKNLQRDRSFHNNEYEAEDFLSHIFFFDENIDQYTAKEINECMLYTVFSSKYPMATTYFWKINENSSMIRNFLSGEEILVHIDIRDYTNFNALKFNNIKFVIQTRGNQKVLDSFLKHLEIKMTHLGNSHFHCDGKFYVKIADSLEFRHSFAENSYGDPITRNKVFDKVRNGVYFISPYSTWKIKLVASTKETNVVNLVRFSKEVDLLLEGEGQFLSDECLYFCDKLLGDYYEVIPKFKKVFY